MRLIICLCFIAAFTAMRTLPANATAAIYRNGDNPTIGVPIIYPSCNPIFGAFGVFLYYDPYGNATCNSCCSEPDKILKDQYRGPDPLGGKALDEWYLDTFWPPLEHQIVETTNRIVTQISSESSTLSGFMDAQSNIKARGALQKGAAQAAKNYAPSEALCRYATLAQGLAASEADSNQIKELMSKRSFARQLLVKNTAAGTNVSGDDPVTKGQSADKHARWTQYTELFCDPRDQGLGKSGVCTGSNDTQYNSDINYPKTIAEAVSLDIGASSAATSKDVENVNAMADNLYAHDISNNVPTPQEIDPSVAGNYENIRKYMLLRSILAKRAVAENSFSSIAAMKAKGSTGTADATKKLMMELGISKEEAGKFVGDNPSYFSQMEALTKKMYQSPAFYVNLMEGPANVQRQQAAMKALEVMQQRDMYKSLARSEMLFATLLDIYVSREEGGLNKQTVQSK